MRSLLFVCTAALLLWGNVAEKEPPKSRKADEPAPEKSPKADEPDISSKRATWQRELARRFTAQVPPIKNYWEHKGKYMELAIQKLDKKIPEMRRKYTLSKEENKTLAAMLEISNRKLYDATLELNRAEEQWESCKDDQ
ncbi:uncharacterized protein LOC111078443 [Drosophila obscura]|uniref:uncharacterized protein LOC111078443 n=1 Tax=Drosophila obscura TaxID=7282 RepID=UPI001BB1BDBA|nr:uncharacterized protein LOC111078443 [Drosophila obscura]